ncbi:MAG TPA: M1 family aminopeptidase [Ignavibacteria bacterium]|nr:M1 family aminopeptidase [Ignavibacteria bacterium]
MMFNTIFKFELKYWLKNFSIYIYSVVIFLIALVSMAGEAGIFGEGSTGSGIANSPLSLYSFVDFFSKRMLILIPAIIGYSVYRDFKENFHSVLFTYPVSKASYLAGKFFSSFLIVLISGLFLIFGLIAGTFIPGVNNNLLISFDPFVYAQLFIVYMIPNFLFTGILIFGIVLFTRNLYSGFILVFIVFVFREILLRLSGGIRDHIFAAIADPFGEAATNYYINDLTITEFNVSPLPSGILIILNRLIWVLLSFFISLLIYRKFAFTQERNIQLFKFIGRFKNKKANVTAIKDPEIVKVSYRFNIFRNIKTAVYICLTDLKFIITSGSFISLLAAGLILIAVVFLQMDPQTDTRILPVTSKILGLPVFFFSFIIIGMTFLYSGIIINRPKASGIESLINVTATPDSVFYFSKLLAIIFMQAILLGFVMITGIALQIYSGYFNFELRLYLFELFIINYSGFIIWAIASFFVHSLTKNILFGFFMLILLLFGIGNLNSAGIETNVLLFNKNPDPDMIFKHSDLNGYGHTLIPFFIYKIYWSIFGLFLCSLTLLIWQRKITYTPQERIKTWKNRFGGLAAFMISGLITIIIISGVFLYLEEKKPLNIRLTDDEKNYQLKKFRENYGKYRNMPQPRISSVKINLDIYPGENNFKADGHYILVNRTKQLIDTILMRTGFDEITSVTFAEDVSILSEDNFFKFKVYKLSKGIMPDDSIKISFNIKNKPNTILTQNSNILKNGTFIKQDIFPRLGYFADTVNKMPEDSTALKNHYQSPDEDEVDFETIVSTSEDQTAIAPGVLLEEWTENGRRYFHYKPGRKIKFVVGYNSGVYEFYKEEYKGIEFGIYYNKGHEYNLSGMIDGLKSSYDYNTENFGEYQHTQAIIVEFPRSEGTYATTFANVIPTSEIRFLNDPEYAGKNTIDISFYVAAHELSHQWWGNQVIPADVQGAHFITESVSEYITAKIYERKYGKSSAAKFLDIQLNRYMKGRSSETGNEAPLIYVNPEQTYISYGKGAVALYTLSENIGEDNLNKALREYIDEVKFKGPLYTTSLELLTCLYKYTPESKRYLIRDMFELNDPEKLKEYYKSLNLNSDME